MSQFENLEREQREAVAETFETYKEEFSRSTRSLLRKLLTRYPQFAMDEKKTQLLLSACQAYERQQSAAMRLKKYGLVMIDARGIERPRPEVEMERKYLEIWIRALRDILPNSEVQTIRDESTGARVR